MAAAEPTTGAGEAGEFHGSLLWQAKAHGTFWLFARSRHRLVNEVQRWYWCGAEGKPIPEADALLRRVGCAARTSPTALSSVSSVRVRVVEGQQPRLRDALGGIGLMLTAPRGLGIRKILMSPARIPTAGDAGGASDARVVLVDALTHPVAMLRRLGTRRITFSEAPMVFAEQEDDPDAPLLASVVLPTGGSHRGRSADEAVLARDVAALASLLVVVPEHTLRYAEFRGLDGDLEAAIEAFGLAPAGSRVEALLLCAAGFVGPVSSSTGADDVAMRVVPLSGAERTWDELEEGGESAIVEVKDAVVHGGFLVTRGSDLLVLDAAGDPRRRAVAGQHGVVACGSRHSASALLKLPALEHEDVDRGILVSGRADTNWYHFLVDTLPRLRLLQNADPALPLLVHGSAPPTAHDLLSRLTSRQVIALQPDRAYRVGRLIAVKGRGSTVDTRESEGLNRPVFAATSLRWLREQVAPLLQPDEPTDRVLLVARRGRHRAVRGGRLLNFVPAIRRASRIDPAAADLDAQLAAYSTCRIMVTPGGAAMTNMIFTHPSTITIGLVARVHPPRMIWEGLAEAVDRTYVKVSLPILPALRSFHAAHHRDVVATPASVWRLRRQIARARALSRTSA